MTNLTFDHWRKTYPLKACIFLEIARLRVLREIILDEIRFSKKKIQLSLDLPDLQEG